MKLLEALRNARAILEGMGYTEGGDIHDDLSLAISRLQNKFPAACLEEL